jgi:hypothetical protein
VDEVAGEFRARDLRGLRSSTWRTRVCSPSHRGKVPAADPAGMTCKKRVGKSPEGLTVHGALRACGAAQTGLTLQPSFDQGNHWTYTQDLSRSLPGASRLGGRPADDHMIA